MNPLHRQGTQLEQGQHAGTLGDGPADYDGGCIANLAATVASRFGVAPILNPVRAPLDHSLGLTPRLNAAQTVFLVVLDGVGVRQLTTHCPGGALAAHQKAVLTSVFPSSTAPAITSLLTASAPASHDNPAWYAHVPEANRIVRTLPMNIRGYPDERVPDDLWSWQGWTGSTNQAVERQAFQPRAIFDSEYSRQALRGCARIAYDDPAELIPLIATAASQRAPAGRFAYVYLPQFDSTAHDHGWQSEPARACLQAFDQWFEQCLSAIAGLDALMVVVADHGFIDVPADCQHHLFDFPVLASCLQAPLAGEPRTVFCRVAPQDEQSFLEAHQSCRLGEVSQCVRTADLLSAGWFGPAPIRHSMPRGGTHTLLMHDGHTLTDSMENERPMHFIGMHGGMAVDEMQVPLVLAGLD